MRRSQRMGAGFDGQGSFSGPGAVNRRIPHRAAQSGVRGERHQVHARGACPLAVQVHVIGRPRRLTGQQRGGKLPRSTPRIYVGDIRVSADTKRRHGYRVFVPIVSIHDGLRRERFGIGRASGIAGFSVGAQKVGSRDARTKADNHDHAR